AWPAIAGGGHVLALAPTGSGKTLAAFLGAISRIASGDYPADRLSVLYVSPLKALGEDIRRNLESPIGELGELFRARGVTWPSLRAAARSGDTSQAERRRMLRSPSSRANSSASPSRPRRVPSRRSPTSSAGGSWFAGPAEGPNTVDGPSRSSRR